MTIIVWLQHLRRGKGRAMGCETAGEGIAVLHVIREMDFARTVPYTSVAHERVYENAASCTSLMMMRVRSAKRMARRNSSTTPA